MTDPVNQRERAINLCRELAIEENEQVIRVIVYALEKWTKPQESALALAEEIAREIGGSFWKTHMLNTGLLKFIVRLRADLRESTSPPPQNEQALSAVRPIESRTSVVVGTMSDALARAVRRIMEFDSQESPGEFSTTRRFNELMRILKAEVGDTSPRTQESCPPRGLKPASTNESAKAEQGASNIGDTSPRTQESLKK